MAGRRIDQVDMAVTRWAHGVRELLGLAEQRGFLGPMRCTLAARRDLHAGATSEGRVSQRWPEFVFIPRTDEWVINQTYKDMLGRAPCLAEITVAHWVVLEPRDKRLRADFLGISRRLYWERVGRAKERFGGALAISAEYQDAVA